MDRILYICRGLPGSGKSTFTKTLTDAHFEADMYFMQDGKYNFDASKLGNAHMWCRTSVEKEMVKGTSVIAVSNTFTQDWEMKEYFELANIHNYTVFTIVVENRHGGKNVHNVPNEVLDKMEKRFSLKLR